MAPSPSSLRRPLGACTVLLLLAVLAACGGGTGGSASGTVAAPAGLAASQAALQQKLAAEAPHIVGAGVVTGEPRRRWLERTWAALVPEARAATLGLSALWDPRSGAAPQAGDFAVLNLYNGGGFTCGGGNSCTNGSVTIAEWESLKNYMGQTLSPVFHNSNGASINVFGRLRTALMIVCVMGHITPAAQMDSDGLPAVGTLTLNFPADTSDVIYQDTAAGGCAAGTNIAGQSITSTVTAVSSPHFSKRIDLNMGGHATALWLRLDAAAGALDFMSLEDERPDRYVASRTLVHATGMNSSGSATVAFEFIALGSADGANADSCWSGGHWTCSFEFHRVYLDEAADTAYLVSSMGDPGDAAGGTGSPTNYVRYTAAARPSVLKACAGGGACSGTMAMSIAADGQREPGTNTVYPSAGNAYEACINVSDRSLAADGSLACDLAGVSVTTAATMIEATRGVYAADVMATLLAHTTENSALAFSSAADVYTAADTQ